MAVSIIIVIIFFFDTNNGFKIFKQGVKTLLNRNVYSFQAPRGHAISATAAELMRLKYINIIIIIIMSFALFF